MPTVDVPELIDTIWLRIFESIALCPAERVARMGDREFRIVARLRARSVANDVLEEYGLDTNTRIRRRVHAEVREQYQEMTVEDFRKICGDCCGGAAAAGG